MKSVSEIAKEMGLTRQALYKRISSSPLKDMLEEHIDKSGGFIAISEEGAALIKNFGDATPPANPVNQTVNQEVQPVVTSEVAAVNHAEILNKQLMDENKRMQESLDFFKNQYEASRAELEREREHSRKLSDCVVSLSVQLTDLARGGQILLAAEQNRSSLMNDADEDAPGRVVDYPEGKPRKKGLFGFLFGRR